VEVTVTATGVDTAARRLDALGKAVKVAMKRATSRAMDLAEREIKNRLRLKSHMFGTPTPSRPGEPPALISGTMMRSVHADGPPRWVDRWTIVGKVSPHAVQSRIQELGGFVRVGNRGRIGPQTRENYAYLPPRPYVAPARRLVGPKVERIFAEELAKAVASVGG